MSRKGWWSTAFLGLTGLALGLELFAAVDGDEDTRTWTEHIVTYVDPEVTAVGIGGLSLWLIYHFGIRYWRRARDQS